MMTSVEQHAMIRELQEHEHRMTRDEGELFAMIRKRDYDDEDLDALSRNKLVELHQKYAVTRRSGGNPLDSLFSR